MLYTWRKMDLGVLRKIRYFLFTAEMNGAAIENQSRFKAQLPSEIGVQGEQSRGGR